MPQAERLDSYDFNVGRTIGGLLFLAAVGGVLWIYFGVVKLDRWPIRWLEVNGGFERVSAEQVRKAMAPLVEGSFFAVNALQMRETARELPWVNEVYVQKQWPDTVTVAITEYVPVAHWVDDQLIATNGDTFSVPGAAQIQGLPRLEGPPGTVETVIETWLSFNELLGATGEEIDRITLNARGAWTLELEGGTRVELGREDAELRLRRMAAAWGQLRRLDEHLPLVMDLRYSNGFAVRWPEQAPKQELADNR
jgi:cell division protein FtsQ